MIVVDSSVWIDYFTGVDNSAANTLDNTLGLKPVAIGDLILTEVLQALGMIRTIKLPEDYLRM